MSKSIFNSHPFLKILNSSVIILPSPSNINVYWNFGSLLGMCLLMQILTGLFLAMFYCSDYNLSFMKIVYLCNEVNYGWLMRTIHANGASAFFICMYLHIARGMYYGSYKLMETWMTGISIMFLVMATAFLGYVLPWGQMSFWGATVITNLLSVIPYIGAMIVEWLWGGFAVSNPTLTRFFAIHFMFPFIIVFFVILHLFFLHQNGSNNPLGLSSNFDKIPFHPYFTIKDVVGFIIILFMLMLVCLFNPYYLGDPDNFIEANPMMTPEHIKPEWYFLFAYAILRSIPNKLGGVIALFMSIGVLYLLVLKKNKILSLMHFPMIKLLFWWFIWIVILLTWIGMETVEMPYVLMGQILTFMYFSYFIIFLL